MLSEAGGKDDGKKDKGKGRGKGKEEKEAEEEEAEEPPNILDNKELIDKLELSKTMSKEVSHRLEVASKTKEEIMVTRNKYRPVATRGAILYFVIADMARIDPMYQYSLEYFKQLYVQCITESERPEGDAEDDAVIQRRLDLILEYLTRTTYSNICRGLFERHKLLFSFTMCSKVRCCLYSPMAGACRNLTSLLMHQIMEYAGTLSAAKLALLLRGPGMHVNAAPNPMPDVLSAVGWNLVGVTDEQIPCFSSERWRPPCPPQPRSTDPRTPGRPGRGHDLEHGGVEGVDDVIRAGAHATSPHGARAGRVAQVPGRVRPPPAQGGEGGEGATETSTRIAHTRAHTRTPWCPPVPHAIAPTPRCCSW